MTCSICGADLDGVRVVVSGKVMCVDCCRELHTGDMGETEITMLEAETGGDGGGR
ncbi:MAG: hypothetical protein WC551_10740 [Patescibacteria group bacterium]